MGVVYALLCTRCPLYAADQGKTRCHFIWGWPAFFKPNPGRMGTLPKLSLLVSLGISSLFPIPWLIFRWELLFIYLFSLAGLFATLMKYECRQCSHYECPKNFNQPKEPDLNGLEQGKK
jgi:hypothetical protein